MLQCCRLSLTRTQWFNVFLYFVCARAVTEGSESSSHSTSSDGVNSVNSMSTLSAPRHSSLIMDSFSSESSFLCSSSISSSPSHHFHKEHDTNSFITAVRFHTHTHKHRFVLTNTPLKLSFLQLDPKPQCFLY